MCNTKKERRTQQAAYVVQFYDIFVDTWNHFSRAFINAFWDFLTSAFDSLLHCCDVILDRDSRIVIDDRFNVQHAHEGDGIKSFDIFSNGKSFNTSRMKLNSIKRFRLGIDQ